jgi:ATP synthase proteolipid subunit
MATQSAAVGSFFGHVGVAIALGMASKKNLSIRLYHYLNFERNLTNLISCLDLGAAYGTAKSGIGISSMGVLKPDMIMKSIVPIIMAGILGIYGLIVAVILLQRSKSDISLGNITHYYS